jgi:hypothetical protein
VAKDSSSSLQFFPLPVFLSALPASAFRFNQKKDSRKGAKTQSFLEGF